MSHGGARPNTGPKKGFKWKSTIAKTEYRKRFLARVGGRWDEIIDAKIARAVGVTVLDKKDEKGNRVYDLPPDSQSNKDITDQVMGRASESFDLTTKGEKIGEPFSKIQLLRLAASIHDEKGV